ncbi:TetR/AcrR family transcriptional regulator [Diaminobutyricibacter sp. McL0618]|uniref:TetR/AcrR family transcriptional regulator n=1 Tax=Leifsonia sp. McL0618 TaxID=3415677 RepID=UPI003CFAC577
MVDAPKTRYARGEARIAEIRAAAIELIYEEGIMSVTHRAVAKRANLAASAPSFFFPSIDELIVEAFRSIMQSMFDDLDALGERIIAEDMSREDAVDEYIHLIRDAMPKYDILQFEAYLLARRRPALQAEVDAVIAATHRPASTLVVASRRKDFDWAAPILASFANGFGLYRLGASDVDYSALRTGLLVLMDGLPDQDPGVPKSRSVKSRSAQSAELR